MPSSSDMVKEPEFLEPLHAPASIAAAGATHVRHLRGRKAILACAGVLQQFAADTGQYAAMHGLQFTLRHEYVRRKTPHLFCIVRGEDEGAPLSAANLLGCALLFEYRIFGLNTGLFATGDSTAARTVLALPQHRAQVAATIAAAALRHGRLVLACFRNDVEGLDAAAFPARREGLWAARVRDVSDELPLRSTYEKALETLGKRTRTHLRYYRRRLERETGCSFIADAAPHIARAELARLNEQSLEPVSQRNFNLQYDATAQGRGGFVCGLRGEAGQWLCLAGGWRQGPVSVLQWQVNAKGFPKLSLSTAFRAFLLEHEVSRGTERLCFHGGTSHSISHAFRRAHAVDLLLRRRGAVTTLLVRLIRQLAERDPAIASRGNFLVDALRGDELRWLPIRREDIAKHTASLHPSAQTKL